MEKTAFSAANRAFRDLLRELRIASDLTQVELAKRLDMPQSFVSKYETGERRLDFVETSLVCAALGVEFAELARLYEKRIHALPKHGHPRIRIQRKR